MTSEARPFLIRDAVTRRLPRRLVLLLVVVDQLRRGDHRKEEHQRNDGKDPHGVIEVTQFNFQSKREYSEDAEHANESCDVDWFHSSMD